MPLTRGDKMIIIGAVALAVTVVLGLAILKKPYLFTGGAKSQPADIAPAPTAASALEAPPAAAPAAQVPAVVATPSPAPAPVAVSPAPAAAPAPAAVAAPATTPGAGPKPAPATAGDETLEKMFAEIAGDAAPAGKPGEPKAAVPQGATGGDVKEPVASAVPSPATAPAPAPEPAAAPVEAKPEPKGKAAKAAARAAAKAEAKAKADAAKAKAASAPDVPPGPAPETHSAQPPVDKTAAAKSAVPAKKATPTSEAAKPQAGVAAGNVVRIVAEEKPGEYVLLIQTNKPPANFNKMFMADPPRMVLDIGGAWNYNGPLSSATGNDFIRHIRVGKHADMFRVVLDMAPDATTRLRGAPTATRVPEGVELRIPK